MDLADVVLTITGVGLILLMAVDVFHTLLYPHGTGPVCRMIMRALWVLSRRFAGRASAAAAPAAMAAVIGAWVSLAIMGWALVYLPHLPGGFVYAEGVPQGGDLSEAVYISMVSLSTVGYRRNSRGDAFASVRRRCTSRHGLRVAHGHGRLDPADVPRP